MPPLLVIFGSCCPGHPSGPGVLQLSGESWDVASTSATCGPGSSLLGPGSLGSSRTPTLQGTGSQRGPHGGPTAGVCPGAKVGVLAGASAPGLCLHLGLWEEDGTMSVQPTETVPVWWQLAGPPRPEGHPRTHTRPADAVEIVTSLALAAEAARGVHAVVLLPAGHGGGRALVHVCKGGRERPQRVPGLGQTQGNTALLCSRGAGRPWSLRPPAHMNLSRQTRPGTHRALSVLGVTGKKAPFPGRGLGWLTTPQPKTQRTKSKRLARDSVFWVCQDGFHLDYEAHEVGASS